MNQILAKLYEGLNLSGAVSGVIYMPIIDARTLNVIKVKTDENVITVDAVWQLKKNGVVITGAEAITIGVGNKIGTVSALAVALVEGDELTLDLLSGAVSSPVTLFITTTKTVGTDEITEVTDKKYVTDAEKTKLANTSGTNSGNETTTTAGALINGATGKTTPVDADYLGLMDSAASNILKKLSWANLKATLKTYFDSLYPSGSGTSTGTNTGDQTISDATISTTDITTNNVSITKHGFAPKAPNDATKYLDGTGAWSVPAGSGGGGYDGGRPTAPLANYYFRDDFFGGAYGAAVTAMWDCWNSTGAPVTGVANHPGIMQVGNSTIGTVAALTFDKYNNNTPQMVCSNASQLFEINWVFKLTGVMSNTNFRCGLAYDSTVSNPSHGIYVEKLAADTTFFGVTRASGTQSRTAAMATAVTSTWYLIRVRRIDATTVGFTINGGTEVTATTNIPTNALNPFIHIYSADALLKQIDVDFFDLSITGLTRY